MLSFQFTPYLEIKPGKPVRFRLNILRGLNQRFWYALIHTFSCEKQAGQAHTFSQNHFRESSGQSPYSLKSLLEVKPDKHVRSHIKLFSRVKLTIPVHSRCKSSLGC